MLKNHNFIERSIVGILSFFKESIFAEEFARREGFLQSLDPRIKVITFLFFILQILFTKDILILAWIYALCLALAKISKIDLGFFIKRTWVFIPLFSFFIAIPSLFSIFTPGSAVITWKINVVSLVITREGIAVATLFIMRVIASVSFAILLTITTRHFVLLKVLRFFKVPPIFIMILGLCYRYMFLLLEVIENTYLAIKSRVGKITRTDLGRHIVASNISSLWQRSYHLNNEVYKAMLSRGFSGDPVILTNFKTKPLDWLWLVLVACVNLLIFYLY